MFYFFFGLLVVVIVLLFLVIWLIRKNKRLLLSNKPLKKSVYMTLFQKSFDPVMIIKEDRFVDLNEASLRYLGYENKKALLKIHPSDISPEFQSDGFHSKERSDEMLRIAKQNGHHHFEWEHISKTGKILYVEVSLTLININDESHFYVVWRDLEEKKKTEKELHLAIDKAEESDRLKSAFLESISHEIRTPMNAIIGFAQLLNYEQNSKNDISEFVNYINKSGNSLLLIIDNIIDVSSLKSGVMDIYESNIQLNKLFDEVYESFTDDTMVKDLKVEVDNKLMSDNLCISTDGSRLRKTLFQIVNNSIKFTEKGNVVFGCFLKGEMLEFFVHDTGVGIPDEDKDFVFNVFRKGRVKDDKLYSGTGLGLSIAKASIESMGGKIWIESTSKQGTKVHFTIPFKKIEN